MTQWVPTPPAPGVSVFRASRGPVRVGLLQELPWSPCSPCASRDVHGTDGQRKGRGCGDHATSGDFSLSPPHFFSPLLFLSLFSRPFVACQPSFPRPSILTLVLSCIFSCSFPYLCPCPLSFPSLIPPHPVTYFPPCTPISLPHSSPSHPIPVSPHPHPSPFPSHLHTHPIIR